MTSALWGDYLSKKHASYTSGSEQRKGEEERKRYRQSVTSCNMWHRCMARSSSSGFLSITLFLLRSAPILGVDFVDCNLACLVYWCSPGNRSRAAQPIPSSKFITPFASTIIPSSSYFSDPLNAYAHHGMPKPFVHLFGPPLDVALDARITGDEARFVRSGCRPNAVLRPTICSPTKGTDQRDPSSSKCRDSETLTFGVFALRDVKANEEVVLGWEWDDGSAVHHLPALIEAPHMFQAHHLSYIRNQMASMLHALSSTFTTCACGSKAKDCALNLMAEFVDGRLSVAASPLSQRANDPGGTDPRSHRVDLGPLVGAQRGSHTREKLPLNCGTGPGDQRATVLRQLMPPGSCRRKTTFYRITSTVGFRQQSIPYKSPSTIETRNAVSRKSHS